MEAIGRRAIRSPLTNRSYSFQQKLLIVAPESRKVMLNQYIHVLNRQTIQVGNQIYISLWDLVRIFSPDWRLSGGSTVRCAECEIVFQADYRDVRRGSDVVILENPPFEKEEWLFVPAAEVMEKVFGWHVFPLGSYIGICERERDKILNFDGPDGRDFTERQLDFRFRKTMGDMYDTIWMPEVERINVFRMYIPSDYDGSRAYKLLLCLHGGNGNSDSVFVRSGQRLQYYAEKYGYILLAPNSFVSGSNYGGCIPPIHMFPEQEAEGRTQFYSEDERAENQIAQNYLKQVLDGVLESFHIDRNRMFVMGNSMGSIGTFHVLSVWPQLFRAAAPSGAMPLTQFLNVERLKKTPMYFVAGTEDHNDGADMRRRCRELQEKGVPIRFQMVGGGSHAGAWVQELESVFQFFESI